ncbi:hypothetical protein [Streptomyces sp. NBC_00827]|uniref:hypothetical protein n=1 Tax=Streptomyces sp. NBC_00827 TaxID=2903677 RepID=UPI00386606A6|nr:hypothetical protein OG569_02315 [Streptomyces sp. NBC_00827]
MNASSQTPTPAPSPLTAAVGVIKAEMREGDSSALGIAAAEQQAGILFDAVRVEAVASAARDQARAESRAEIAQLRQEAAALDWFRTRLSAVGQLCAGRLDEDLLQVREILTAADGRQATGAPLTVMWDQIVMGPSGDTPKENTLVPCTTARGGPAVLVLDDERRLALGGLLLASLHAVEACPMPGCGTSADDLDASDPTVAGWICVQVAGTDGPARWWCSPWCMNGAVTAAAAELADIDRAAAVDPGQQHPRYGPGASDEHDLQVAEATDAGFEDERGDAGDGAW